MEFFNQKLKNMIVGNMEINNFRGVILDLSDKIVILILL